MLTPSPEQLFQSTRHSRRSATPCCFSFGSHLVPVISLRARKAPGVISRGLVCAEPGFPSPWLSLSGGRPGRRRGALTRRKLRNASARVKSPGQHARLHTFPQVTSGQALPRSVEFSPEPPKIHECDLHHSAVAGCLSASQWTLRAASTSDFIDTRPRRKPILSVSDLV